MHIDKALGIINRDSKVIPEFSRIKYFPFVIAKGNGAIVEDVDGNHYIDFLSSAAALNTGHSHPRVVEAIKEQVDKYIHYTSAYIYSEEMVKLAEELNKITPGDSNKTVSFGLTGSDANDGAIKLARAYTGRSKVISFIGGYHGSTYGAISLTAISLNMRRKIGPLLPDIHHIKFPDIYRTENMDPVKATKDAIDSFEVMLNSYLPAEEIAAVIMEPIQGDGGLLVPPQEYMDWISKFCKDNGSLFISEEVQQGMGRTGKWLGIDHFGIEPDIVLKAKSIASGLPLSAIIGREEIMDSLGAPAHLFTMGGNATSAAAALATIDVIREENLLEHSTLMGEHIKSEFKKMAEKYEMIGDIRGHGLSIGIDLVKDRVTKEPHRDAATKICYRCYEKGLILIFLADGVLRIQPPLVISKDEIDRALVIIEESIKDYLDGKISDEVLKFAKGW